jgi:hypothetical protein
MSGLPVMKTRTSECDGWPALGGESIRPAVGKREYRCTILRLSGGSQGHASTLVFRRHRF